MKKTLLVAMLLIGVLMMVFVGCKKESATTSTAAAFPVPEGGYDGSEVTITFYHTMGTNLNTVLAQEFTSTEWFGTSMSAHRILGL